MEPIHSNIALGLPNSVAPPTSHEVPPEIRKFLRSGDGDRFVVEEVDFSQGRNRKLLAELLKYKQNNPDVILHFYKSNFNEVNFDNINLGNTIFEDSSFERASFRGATIGPPSRGSEHFQFRDANFTGADFTGAKIEGVRFTNANFHNTIFLGARIENVMFDNPKNIVTIKLNKSTEFVDSRIGYPREKKGTFEAAQNFFNKVLGMEVFPSNERTIPDIGGEI